MLAPGASFFEDPAAAGAPPEDPAAAAPTDWYAIAGILD